MTTIRQERPADLAAREALLDEAFGKTRYHKTSQRLRADRLPADGLSFIAAEDKRVIGTVRLWPITCGDGAEGLLLGPVAVAAGCRNRRIGTKLVRRALREARRLGHRAVILHGDPGYNRRFGFTAEKTVNLTLPGPFERQRLLALELKPAALDGARGLIQASCHRTAAPPQRRAA